ncbi:hypothetical protein BKA65DRAFT_479655 [Rhexocercosporidium sp. MPI-PUGE-AT-0058]|nr:hypothetical protein BKA65DRAFT_479655 [Rhexocercosporidium sp. MPI-PUGE-AT-0058]
MRNPPVSYPTLLSVLAQRTWATDPYRRVQLSNLFRRGMKTPSVTARPGISSQQPLVSGEEEVWELSKPPAGEKGRERVKGRLCLFVVVAVAVSDPESSLLYRTSVRSRTAPGIRYRSFELSRRSSSDEAQGRVEEKRRVKSKEERSRSRASRGKSLRISQDQRRQSNKERRKSRGNELLGSVIGCTAERMKSCDAMPSVKSGSSHRTADWAGPDRTLVAGVEGLKQKHANAITHLRVEASQAAQACQGAKRYQPQPSSGGFDPGRRRQ